MIKRMHRHRVKNWKIWINKEKGNYWRKSFLVENCELIYFIIGYKYLSI